MEINELYDEYTVLFKNKILSSTTVLPSFPLKTGRLRRPGYPI